MPVTTHGNRADRVMRIGAWLTGAGLAFTLIAIIPLVVPSVELPSALWFLSMLTGVGLVVVFAGMAMSARRRGSGR
jgi:uncharacterized membrane protein SirB2